MKERKSIRRSSFVSLPRGERDISIYANETGITMSSSSLDPFLGARESWSLVATWEQLADFQRDFFKVNQLKLSKKRKIQKGTK
jgi:hypothetical protein